MLEIVLDFNPKTLSFKTRKSQELPLSWKSSQVSTWANQCHYTSFATLIAIALPLYLPYFYHSFRSYQNNWFIISILFYRYSPGNSGGELSSSPASSITSGSTRSHNHKDSKNLKQSNLPSTHPVSHGSWNPFSKKGSDKSNSKTSQHVTPHHINDNIILRW